MSFVFELYLTLLLPGRLGSDLWFLTEQSSLCATHPQILSSISHQSLSRGAKGMSFPAGLRKRKHTMKALGSNFTEPSQLPVDRPVAIRERMQLLHFRASCAAHPAS